QQDDSTQGDEEEEPDENEESDEETDQPSEHHYEDSILEADSHLNLPYRLDDGDTVALWIDSDEPLTVMFMDEDDYASWDNGREVDFHELHESIYKLNTTFAVPNDGDYSI